MEESIITKMNQFYERQKEMNRNRANLRLCFCKKRRRFRPDILYKILTTNSNTHISLNNIKELHQKDNDSFYFSDETLRKYLRENMKFTFRRPRIKTKNALTETVNEISKIYVQEFSKLLLDGYFLIFFDESSIGKKPGKLKSWLYERDNTIYRFEGNFPKFNLLLSCDQNKILY
jgi:hypothetical protein